MSHAVVISIDLTPMRGLSQILLSRLLFTEQPLRRAPEFTLPAVFAGQLPAHQTGAYRTEGRERYDERQHKPAESADERGDPDPEWNERNHEIRHDIQPRDWLGGKALCLLFGKDQRTQPALAESAALPVIITGPAAPGQDTPFHPETVCGVQHGPHDSQAGHQEDADGIDG